MPIRTSFLTIGSDKGEHGQCDFGVFAEVLPRHRRMNRLKLRILSHVIGHDLRQSLVGDQRILKIIPVDVGGDAITGCDGVDLFLEAFAYHDAVGFVEVTDGTLEARLVWNHVPHVAAV